MASDVAERMKEILAEVRAEEAERCARIAESWAALARAAQAKYEHAKYEEIRFLQAAAEMRRRERG